MIPADVIQRALDAIKNPRDLDYFFRKLSSPAWIEPLRKAGLFKPDPSIKNGDGVSFVPWAGSACLKRMATAAPEMVTDTFEHLEGTDNPWIHTDIVDAALAMPAEFAVRLAGIECKWVGGQVRIWGPLVVEYGKLISKLAREGHGKVALQLFRALFGPLPQPSVLSVGLRNAEARIEWVWYGRVLKSVLADLVEHNPGETIETLSDLLEQVVRIERGQEHAAEGSDLSYIWRPAIEDHEQNHEHGIRDALVSAVRDAGVHVSSATQEDRARVVGELDGRRWDIFRRIAMHVIWEGGDDATGLAEARIVDRANFDNIAFRHEYARLLRVFFERLSVESQSLLLGWIDAGYPYLASWVEREKGEKSEKGEKGVEPSEEERRRVDDYWKFERVHPFHESLPEDWKTRYATWRQQFDIPELAEFVTHHRTGGGGESPKSGDELARMEAGELVRFLLAFEPSDRWDGPTLYGLSHALRAAVVLSAGRFSAEAAGFKIEAPEYVECVLGGFDEALRAGTALNWGPLLDLCEWVVRQPREIPGREDHEYGLTGTVPGWKWARASIASLLERGMEGDPGAIPFELRERVWAVLSVLAEDPDPAPDGSEEGASEGDPFTRSLNRTRGKAMHAVVRYTVWVARHLPRTNANELRLERGLDEIPKARAVLERHLDPMVDRSPAIRAFYGHYLPLLSAIDPTWASSVRERVFPPKGRDDDLWKAAWEGYISYNHVYKFAEELLREYGRAVEQSRDGERSGPLTGEPGKRLAEHIMILFGRGTVALGENCLVARFFEQAPCGLQAHAIKFVGRSLSGESPPSEDVLARFRGLWTWSLARAEKSQTGDASREVLASFSSWFVCGNFDASWSIRGLEKVLEIAVRVEDAFLVIQALPTFVESHPRETLRCLSRIVESDANGWDVSAAVDSVREVVSQCVRSADHVIRREAHEVIHLLGSRGFHSFRALLSDRVG